MDPNFYVRLDAIQEKHWWYVARRAILTRVLEQVVATGLPPGKLYDLGCGVGANLPVLEKFGPTVGVDMSETAIEFCRRRGRSNVTVADLNSLQGIPEASGSLVLLGDVLEHLDDEQPCLEATHRALAPGGVLVATVPAHMFMWGPSDVVNHHKRRYDSASFRRLIGSMFEIEHFTYFNTLLFAPIVLGRLAEALLKRPGDDAAHLPPPLINRAAQAIFGREAGLVAKYRLPIGVSLLCIARKR